MAVDTTSVPDGARQGPVLPEPTLLAKGLAALRVFFGLIFLANGLSKLTGYGDIAIGWYNAILIDRDLTRTILENEGARTEFPLVGRIAEDLILPNYGFFQWAITFLEIGIGGLLVLGLASRGAALAGLGQQLFLAALYFSSNRWAFEQPHEYVPLIILAIVPAGRVWGLDGRIWRARPALRRWPF